jgi:nitroimidazol reductase NimA-like FMN-containing flavoprotein (pyridoxamine 5'-phosphate oxidase superfamily)
MLIQEVTPEDSLSLLSHLRLGRLACAEGAQPYVVPFYFAYDDGYLYSFSTVGQKINWMRANPLVCVQTGETASSEEWVSLVIFGRYEELPDTPELKSERDLAYQLLQRKGIWWEPGYARTIIKGVERPLVPVYFRIQIDRITGHHGASDDTRAADVNLRKSPTVQASKHAVQGILAALRAKLFPK